MDFIKEMLQKETTKKFGAFICLIGLVYALRSMIDLILLTFLFAYLVHSLQKLVVRNLEKIMPVNQVVITIFLYGFLFVMIAIIIYKYIPTIINQCILIVYEIKKFKMDINVSPTLEYLLMAFQGVNLSEYTAEGVTFLIGFATNIGKVSVNIFLALILSMFFMLERFKVANFMKKFEQSKISGFYKYVEIFAVNFLNSFGKVIQAQILIAFTNSVLSTISLYFLGFPQLLGLGGMIFVLSLIPVAGTVISLVPLAIIAFNIGGVVKVMYILILIALLHALESYFLNPKFMADKTDLPIFFIFMLLIIGEHFLGTWGLLIGIPLFIFLLDLLGVNLKEK